MPYLRALYDHLKKMKFYLLAAVLIFAGGIVMGMSSNVFAAYLDQQLEGIGKLAETIRQKEHPQIWFFALIFFNNAIKSIVIIYLGAVFGVLPVLFLAVNGMILGYLFSKALAIQENLFQLIVQGILPHGIIEIPAIIIACAYGMKFGMLMSRGIFSLIQPTARSAWGEEIGHFLRMTVPLMIVLVMMLFVAAVIESTFTYWLVQ